MTQYCNREPYLCHNICHTCKTHNANKIVHPLEASN